MATHEPEDPVDLASAGSFPASDPPSWTGTTAGAPPSDAAGFDRRQLTARIARLWWAVALRGAAAVVLGLLAILWPAITLVSLVLVFAVYCIIDAVFSIILAVRGAKWGGRWIWPALHALVDIAAAERALFWPGLTLVSFVAVFVVWAIVTGIVTIVAALRLERGHGRRWMIAGGVAAILVGMEIALLPPLGVFTLVWLVASAAFLSGASLLALAHRLRQRNRRVHGAVRAARA